VTTKQKRSIHIYRYSQCISRSIKYSHAVEIGNPMIIPKVIFMVIKSVFIFIESQTGLGWKGPQSPPRPSPCHGQGCPPAAQVPRAPSNLALSASRDGAPQLHWAAVPAPHRPLSCFVLEFDKVTSPLLKIIYLENVSFLDGEIQVKTMISLAHCAEETAVRKRMYILLEALLWVKEARCNFKQKIRIVF